MSKIADYFRKNIAKRKKPLHYKEIFSTSENIKNTQNTNPLNVSDETQILLDNNDKTCRPKWYNNFEKRKKEISHQEIISNCPEYNGPIYTHAVKDSLRKNIKTLNKEILVLVLMFVLSVIVDVLFKFYYNAISIPFVSSSFIYSITSVMLLLVSFIFSFKTVKQAFLHLGKFVFTIDTAMVFPAIITTLNCCATLVFSILMPSSFQPNTVVSLFLLSFILIDLTRLTNERRILNNLRFITSSKQKYNIEISSLSNVTKDANLKKKTKAKKNTFTLYQHKTDFLANFIINSRDESNVEKIISIFIPVSTLLSIGCGVVDFIFTLDIMLTISTMNLAAILFLPLALPFVASIITSSLSKFALKNKAMITGIDAFIKISRAKSVVLDDTDLYPQNNVVLRGIKTFSGQRVDEAILLATAIVCRLGSPVSRVFEKVILGKKTVLTKASNVKYIEGKGVTGWVNSQRVLVGNRELLNEYKLPAPSHDYEKKYNRPNCELTYLAVGRKLVAMFILEYLPSKSLYNTLRACVKNNINIFVKTSDCNITLQKIANDFSIPKKYVTFLTHDEKNNSDTLFKQTTSKSEAAASTLGGSLSLLKVLYASIRAKNKMYLGAAIQCLQLIVNLFLIFNVEISALHNVECLTYVFLWLVYIVVVCCTKISQKTLA